MYTGYEQPAPGGQLETFDRQSIGKSISVSKSLQFSSTRGVSGMGLYRRLLYTALDRMRKHPTVKLTSLSDFCSFCSLTFL